MTNPDNPVSKWNFDTLVTYPVYTAQPVNVLVNAGQSAQFVVSVDSLFVPVTYLWKKSADNANDTPGDDTDAGSTSDTLTISSVAIANEGYYYCAATNSNGTTNSNVARLGVKRQLAHWTMDSPLVGNQYPDSSTEDPVADNIDPNVPGSVSFVPGPYAFGATSAISVDDNSIGSGATTLDPSAYSDQLTVTAWIRLTGTLTAEDGYGIVVKGTGDALDAANYRWTFYSRLSGSEPSVRLLSWNGGDAWTDANSIVLDEWAHVTATVGDGKEAAVYINGVQNGETSDDFNFGDDGAGPMRIGDYGTSAGLNNKFPGEIDDIKIYNYGMTVEEVIDMYNATPAPDTYGCLDLLNAGGTFDANGDCRVTIEDFAIIAGNWLNCGRYPAESCGW
jgi:hypothetical protein